MIILFTLRGELSDSDKMIVEVMYGRKPNKGTKSNLIVVALTQLC